jgi:hypothetical protein
LITEACKTQKIQKEIFPASKSGSAKLSSRLNPTIATLTDIHAISERALYLAFASESDVFDSVPAQRGGQTGDLIGCAQRD